MAKLILAGRKTQTRRRSSRYVVGKSYALQTGRGKPATSRITITDVRQEPLGAITLRDARREGFRTTADFKAYWAELHGSFNPDETVHVVSFVLGDLTDTPRLLAGHPGGPEGDYVSSPLRALNETSEEVSSAVQGRFAAEGKVNLALAHSVPRERLLEAVEAMRRQTGNAKHRRRWRSIEHQLSMMQREAS